MYCQHQADAERLKAIDGSVMPTEITGIAPDPLREVVRLGRSDNITIPTLGSATELRTNH